jgi:drug/metabolite transporter (DMT)-like permease
VLALLLALVAALGYGLSDFTGGLASRHTDALRVVLVSYPVSAVLVAAVAPLAGGAPDVAAMTWGAASGVAGGLAVLWFYAALASGPMSVVSPVTALLTASLPLLGGLLLGEQPGPGALVGAVLAVGAVVLVSKEERGPVDGAPTRVTPRVLLLTLGAGFLFAVYFMLLHRIGVGTGLWPMFASRVAASVAVIAAAAVSGRLRLATGRPGAWAITAGGLDVLANVAMLYALQAGLLSLVSVVASLYPAATVLMARLVLGERSGRMQKIGLVLAAVAVALIAGTS